MIPVKERYDYFLNKLTLRMPWIIPQAAIASKPENRTNKQSLIGFLQKYRKNLVVNTNKTNTKTYQLL